MKFKQKIIKKYSVLAGPVVDIKTGKEIVPGKEKWAKHGFDLTNLDLRFWKKLIKDLGISETPVLDGGAWLWTGDGIEIATGNDPISGKFASGKRQLEVGYLSYVGIEGDPAKVKKVVDLIKESGDYKDESVGKRDFI